MLQPPRPSVIAKTATAVPPSSSESGRPTRAATTTRSGRSWKKSSPTSERTAPSDDDFPAAEYQHRVPPQSPREGGQPTDRRVVRTPARGERAIGQSVPPGDRGLRGAPRSCSRRLEERSLHDTEPSTPGPFGRDARLPPPDTRTMRKAAGLWAEARNSGLPTADPEALDGDAILAAQALLVGGLVVTENVRQLERFVRAYRWADLPWNPDGLCLRCVPRARHHPPGTWRVESGDFPPPVSHLKAGSSLWRWSDR